MEIRAKEYIDSGFSSDDAQKIFEVLKQYMEERAPITVDFSGVKYFTTLFFNQAITIFLKDMSQEEFDQRIKIVNLSAVGKATYKHSYEYAVEYYALSPEEREAYQMIVETATED